MESIEYSLYFSGFVQVSKFSHGFCFYNKKPISVSIMYYYFLGIYNFLSLTFLVTLGCFLDYASRRLREGGF